MTTDLIIICVTVLLLALIFVIAAEREHREGRIKVDAGQHGPEIGARVLVHKLDGQGLQGDVAAYDIAGVVLEKVDLISDGQKTATGGRWYVAVDRIDSIQEL